MIRKKFFSHLNKKTQKILHSTSGETIAETLDDWKNKLK